MIAISTKLSGSMRKPDGVIDLDKIKQYIKENKLPEKVVCMSQEHGGAVAIVSDSKQEIVPGVDGLITTNKKITLAVLTADCLPILFQDQKKQVIAVAHAGSKGLLKGIIQNVMNELKSKFACDPSDIIVVIGPAIEAKCYEVKQEYLNSFKELFPTLTNIYFTKDGRFYLDLRSIALQCLNQAGILKEHIAMSDVCTRHDFYNYYSYRAGDKTDRFVSVISI